MRQEDEQGFLSDKFDDWSGEPIPNGWNSLEHKLKKEKYKKNVLLAGIPILLLLSFLLKIPFTLTVKNEEIVHTNGASAISDNFSKKNSSPVAFARPSDRVIPGFSKTTNPRGRSGRKLSETALASYQGRSESAGESGLENQDLIAYEEITSSELPNFMLSEGRSPQQDIFGDFRTAPPSQLDLLATRNSEFVYQTDAAGFGKPVARQVEIQPARFKGWINKFFTMHASWAVSSIEINQSLEERWKYSASGAGFSKAGAVALGFRLEKPISRTQAIFYGMESGVFIRRSEIMSMNQATLSYRIVSESDTRYIVQAENQSQKEIRESMMVFARAELGLRQAVTRNSGIIASAQLWTRIASDARSSRSDAAVFQNPNASLSAGYRLGAWMQTGPFTQLELCYSAAPEHLMPFTSGMQFKTASLGLHLKQSF